MESLENEVYYCYEVEEAEDDDIGDDGEDVDEEEEGHGNDHDADHEAPLEGGDEEEQDNEEDADELQAAGSDDAGSDDHGDDSDENVADPAVPDILEIMATLPDEDPDEDSEGSSNLTGEDLDKPQASGGPELKERGPIQTTEGKMMIDDRESFNTKAAEESSYF